MEMSEQLGIYKAVAEYYGVNCVPDLERAATVLKRAFEDKLSNEPALMNLSSAYDGVRFEVRTRVKSPVSLEEKLVRGSEGLSLLRTIERACDFKPETVRPWLLQFPDVVGIKIVCDLKVDTETVYNKLRRTADNWDGHLTFTDLVPQPQKMKNGKKLYRIKGTYTGHGEAIGFELQIKSRLSDAWGELEHPWFYKSYQYTPVRDVLQMGMNAVGRMLDEVDTYLLELRDKSSLNLEAYRTVRFFTDLHEVYGKALHQTFGREYPMDQIQDLLLFCFVHSPHEWKEEEDDDADDEDARQEALPQHVSIGLDPVTTLALTPPSPESTMSKGFVHCWMQSYQMQVTWAIVSDWKDRLWNCSEEEVVERIYRGAATFLFAKSNREIDRRVTYDALRIISSHLPAAKVLEAFVDHQPYCDATAVLRDTVLGPFSPKESVFAALVLAYLKVDRKAFEGFLDSIGPSVRDTILTTFKSNAVSDKLRPQLQRTLDWFGR